jgi:hypothetical protein
MSKTQKSLMTKMQLVWNFKLLWFIRILMGVCFAGPAMERHPLLLWNLFRMRSVAVRVSKRDWTISCPSHVETVFTSVARCSRKGKAVLFCIYFILVFFLIQYFRLFPLWVCSKTLWREILLIFFIKSISGLILIGLSC